MQESMRIDQHKKTSKGKEFWRTKCQKVKKRHKRSKFFCSFTEEGIISQQATYRVRPFVFSMFRLSTSFPQIKVRTFVNFNHLLKPFWKRWKIPFKLKSLPSLITVKIFSTNRQRSINRKIKSVIRPFVELIQRSPPRWESALNLHIQVSVAVHHGLLRRWVPTTTTTDDDSIGRALHCIA